MYTWGMFPYVYICILLYTCSFFVSAKFFRLFGILILFFDIYYKLK